MSLWHKLRTVIRIILMTPRRVVEEEPAGPDEFLLLETGDFFLLESGDKLVLD